LARVLALCGAVALAGGCASAAGSASIRDDPARVESLAAHFDSLRRAERIPGLAVVILRDTTVVLARGFGFADVEAGVPVTPETPFNVASVAKPISAVVALRLAQDGC
jgi:CubicO group peptidase (beta-lactamase class C family)